MDEFNTGRGEISILSSISLISGGICSYFVAKLLENRSSRKFMLWGSIIGSIGFFLSASVNSLWQLYVLFFIVGIGLNGIAGSVPIAILISKWFAKKRGLALGIAWSGFPLGSMVVMPIIGLIVEQSGWRASFLFAGAVTLVTSIPLLLWVVKDTPEEMGLLPDGNRVKEVKNTPTSKTAIETDNSTADKPRLITYLKSAPLWLISIGFCLLVMSEMAVIQHEVSFVTDMGISAVLAASAFGFTAGMSGFGRWGTGWLADKISPRYVIILLTGIEIIGIIILLQTRTMAMVWIFAVIWGVASGSFFSILPLIVRDIFPASAFNTVFGFVNGLFFLAMGLGTPLAGFIFDATGSYHWVFILVIIFYTLAIISTYLAYGIKPGRLRSIPKGDSDN